MRAVIYTRVSKDQFGDERSPERQETACRAYADARDWTVHQAFRDVDLSAYREVDRPGYRALVEAVDSGTVDVVCVWKLDRLVRRVADFESFWAVCERSGVALASVTEPIDTSSALGTALVRILVSFAALESATKSVRLQAAARDRAARGEPPHGRSAFGYTADWQVVDREAALVREAARRVLEGETMAEVVRDWTLRGVRTRSGALWSVHGLRDVLLAPRFWGGRVYKGEVVATGDWQPIITPSEGAQLRLLLADASRRREPRVGRPSLLTGLLRCGRCHSRMVTRKSTSGDPTYCCPGAPRGCNGTSVRQRHADGVTIEAALAELEMRDVRIPRALAALSEAEIVDAVTRHAAALRAAAEDHYVRQVIDRRTFLAVRDRLDEELHAATLGAGERPVPERLRAFFRRPRQAWPSMSRADQRVALALVVDHVVIHPAPRGTGRFHPDRVQVLLRGQRSAPEPARPAPAAEVLSAEDAARVLDVCTQTVHRMIRRGDLRAVKDGGGWVIDRVDVLRLFDERRATAVKRLRRSSVGFDTILREHNGPV